MSDKQYDAYVSGLGPQHIKETFDPQQYAAAMLGQPRASVLMTDGYKFSMAQAGFPLRTETFVLSLRRGGPFYIPFDLAAVVQNLRPLPPTVKEAAFLTANGYGLSPAMEKALEGPLEIWAPPAGSWILAGEPVLTITGPSFLVSWLEPLAIMLHYPIQVATHLKTHGTMYKAPSCESQKRLLEMIVDTVPVPQPDHVAIEVAPSSKYYTSNVEYRSDQIVDALQGDGSRAFEVGLRAATCMEEHLLALQACKRAGINKTSNVFGAWKFYMTPVGTTGHEHQQRWGSDETGFGAIRDMRPEPPSYLFDTYDPIKSGIPALKKVLAESTRPCTVRFDSGDQDQQLQMLLAAEPNFAIKPTFIFEDGYTAERTAANEKFCESIGLTDPNRRMYGYGGYLINSGTEEHYRDAVSAAYKLSATGGHATRKISGTPGKDSLPGRPCIFRAGTLSWIGQIGEQMPVGFAPIAPASEAPTISDKSPKTCDLNDQCRRLPLHERA